MPPKPARGRGRGRAGGNAGSSTGRGGANAGRAPPAQEPPTAAEASSSQPSAAQTTTTPQNELQSPNSSPVTIPTETPAPTPVRAPSERAGPKPSAAPRKYKPKPVRRAQSEREELARLEYERLERLNKKAEEKQAFAARGGKNGRGRGDTMGKRFVAGRSGGNGGAEGMFSTLPSALGMLLLFSRTWDWELMPRFW